MDTVPFYLGNGFVRHWRQFLADPTETRHPVTFWYLAADAPKSFLTGALQLPVVLTALPGIIHAPHRRSWALALLVPVAGIMGTSVVIFAFTRFSATIMPYLIGLAIYGLWFSEGQSQDQVRRNS